MVRLWDDDDDAEPRARRGAADGSGSRAGWWARTGKRAKHTATVKYWYYY